MTKKEMISELVKEFGFDESTLDDKLKSEVEEIYDGYFSSFEEVEESSNEKKGLEYIDDYVETNENRVLVEKSPSEVVSEEKEKIYISKLSKRELRNLRRSSNI